MIDIDNLIFITRNLGLENIVAELEFYKNRIQSTDKDLILPLVGEFSSGKTSLINSLLDNPNLETASRATTASIFEVKFGSGSCYAEIVNKEGNIEQVNDVTEIKNSTLANVEMVRVFDTSTKIGSSTILVDTPGLSSNDPLHRIALSSYLPKADAVLLLTDINQQITRSLLDFVSSSQICRCPIYLVITKCDTKTPNEIEEAKEYIRKNIDFEFASIIAVSSTNGIMNEFDDLIAKIQEQKNSIVEQSVSIRIKDIAAQVLEIINDLLKQSNNVEDINRRIQENENNLKKIGQAIDNLIHEAQDRIDENAENYYKQFKKLIFPQLDSIVKTQGRNCDQAVYGAVNSCGAMIIQNFRRDVITDVINLARRHRSESGTIPINSLETINVSEQAFNGFTYNINLSAAGHKWDETIGGIFTLASATMKAINSAKSNDTTNNSTTNIETETGSTSTENTTSKTNKLQKVSEAVTVAGKFTKEVTDNMDDIQTSNQSLGEQLNMKRGFIETSVGWITEFFAKPARQRAVNDYLDNTLLPELRLKLSNLGYTLLREISTLINQESQSILDAMHSNLESMKMDLIEKNEEYMRKMNTYKEYSEQLKQYLS